MNTTINWSKFVPDLAILLLYFFFLDPLMKWQLGHLDTSCSLLMLLNIAAVGIGCYSFFSGYADIDALTQYRNSLSKFESSALGLSAFISCLGFFWWLVPFAGAKELGIRETGFIWGMTVYFITFIGVVAGTVNKKKGEIKIPSAFIQLIANIITIVFFFFSYAFLLVTLQHWQPNWIATPYLAIICLAVFYLPLRFFLLLRPPLHKLEYLSFILSFGFLLWELFVRV
jgi:hypothetical protein